MWLIILIPLYLLANAYVLRWLFLWFAIIQMPLHQMMLIIAICIYCFLAMSILLAFLFKFRWLVHLSNIWFAMFPYLLISILICDGGRLILKYIIGINFSEEVSGRTVIIIGCICMAVVLVISCYGFLNAKIIHTTNYAVLIRKRSKIKQMRIVLAADLHLGYNTGNKMMKQMVKKINEENADLVIIAGDIFDNDFDALKYPDKVTETLKQIKSREGVYACYGNHDISERILAGFTFGSKNEKKLSDERMDKLLENADIKLLKDEGVILPEEIYLYGRPDLQRPNRGIEIRKTPEEITADMDKTKPIIIIDHQPKELTELANAGVDLDLSGHTHAGQMFPAGAGVRMMWKNAHGMMKIGNMHSIVTAGVGVFGPNMRVGARPEISVIDVAFEHVRK